MSNKAGDAMAWIEERSKGGSVCIRHTTTDNPADNPHSARYPWCVSWTTMPLGRRFDCYAATLWEAMEQAIAESAKPRDLELDAKQADEVMRTHEWRVVHNRPEIFYDGLWREVIRTDLHDDIATSRHEAFHSLEYWRSFYWKRMKYGARIKPLRVQPDGSIAPSLFCVIDAYSDG